LSSQQTDTDVPDDHHAGSTLRGADALEFEQANLLFSQAIPTVSAAFIVATVMMAVLWAVAPIQHLLIWWGSILLMTAYRIGLVLAYNRNTEKRKHIKKWLAGFCVGNMASGLLWSASILLLNPDWPFRLPVSLPAPIHMR